MKQKFKIGDRVVATGATTGIFYCRNGIIVDEDEKNKRNIYVVSFFYHSSFLNHDDVVKTTWFFENELTSVDKYYYQDFKDKIKDRMK